MTEPDQPQSEADNPAEPEPPSGIGRVEWIDLTVAEAGRIRDFYRAVVGWRSQEVDMGNYVDFNLISESGDTVAGLCHARGSNANQPGQWLIYVRVASVADSLVECERRGGKVLDGPRRMGGKQFGVVQDPAGACLALISA